MIRSKLLRLALEESSDGKANREIEYEYYGKLIDLSQLDKASSKEHHEQWEFKIPKTENNAGKGRIRVRKTIKNDGTIEYVNTTKSILEKSNDRIELSIPTTEDGFKQFRILSDTGMIKDRYMFPVDDYVFEVDMFLKPDGTYHEYCKIDLEVKSKTENIPEIPIKLEDLIINQYGNRTNIEIKLLDKLFKECFISRNIYL